jgi:drug/metabolite transporter (DMT)-like permease
MYDKLKNDILTADFSDDEENPGEVRLSTDNPHRGGLQYRGNRQNSSARASFDRERIASVNSVAGKDVEMLHGELDNDETPNDKDNTRMLMISFVLMVFVGLGNKVFQKLMTIPMRNYPNYLNIMTTFIYVPVSFAYIMPAVRSGYIPKEQAEMSKKPFFVMGALDAVAAIMQVFAATYLPGPLLILLSQAAIPMSMLISRYMLNAHYSKLQYFGALVVVGGIICVLAPTLNGEGSVLWEIVMIMSNLPQALSSVYKEIALGDTALDPIFLNGWIAVFQLLFSLILCVPASQASEPPINISELPQNLWDGLLCYGGHNSVTCADDADDGECSPDDCSSSTLFVTLYLMFNIGYNILIILIIKYGSSNLLYMALTLMVPLGNCAFTLNFVPGHAPLRSTDIFGLIIICAGLFAYRFANGLVKKYMGGECCGIDVVSAGPQVDVDKKPLMDDYFETIDGNSKISVDSTVLNQTVNDSGLSLHEKSQLEGGQDIQ